MLNFKIEAKFANSNLSAQLIFVLSILFCIKFQMIALSRVGVCVGVLPLTLSLVGVLALLKFRFCYIRKLTPYCIGWNRCNLLLDKERDPYRHAFWCRLKMDKLDP